MLSPPTFKTVYVQASDFPKTKAFNLQLSFDINIMSHRKVLSQGNNVPFPWEENPGASKFCFRDFQALALRSSPAPSFFGRGDSGQYDDVVCKIPLPPCRTQPRPTRNVSITESRWEEDPFLVAYKECTKSVKKEKFVKKSKLFGFSCKSVDSCEIRDAGFFKLPRDRFGNRR